MKAPIRFELMFKSYRFWEKFGGGGGKSKLHVLDFILFISIGNMSQNRDVPYHLKCKP